MLSKRAGSIHLFRFAGIDVFLHWSWFLVALLEIQGRSRNYSSPLWNVIEYLALFLIVLMHEFGHSLACRQVGGVANTIVLWPLGGVAFVNAPQRPGATLWSIAAGPLVNVALLPILYAATTFAGASGWEAAEPSNPVLRGCAIAVTVWLDCNNSAVACPTAPLSSSIRPTRPYFSISARKSRA